MATGGMSGIGFLGGLLKGLMQGDMTRRELALKDAYADVQKGYLDMAQQKLPLLLESMRLANEGNRYNLDTMEAIPAQKRAQADFFSKYLMPAFNMAERYGAPAKTFANKYLLGVNLSGVPDASYEERAYGRQVDMANLQHKNRMEEIGLSRDLYGKWRLAQEKAKAAAKRANGKTSVKGMTPSQIATRVNSIIGGMQSLLTKTSKTLSTVGFDSSDIDEVNALLSAVNTDALMKIVQNHPEVLRDVRQISADVARLRGMAAKVNSAPNYEDALAQLKQMAKQVKDEISSILYGGRYTTSADNGAANNGAAVRASEFYNKFISKLPR